MTEAEFIEYAARLVHETNRAYCEELHEETPHLPWDEAPEWQRESVRDGIVKHLNNPHLTPEDSHKAWMAYKLSTGWKYGPVKDGEKKHHPLMRPWFDLPVTQRMKDYIVASVVRALVRVHGIR